MSEIKETISNDIVAVESNDVLAVTDNFMTSIQKEDGSLLACQIPLETIGKYAPDVVKTILDMKDKTPSPKQAGNKKILFEITNLKDGDVLKAVGGKKAGSKPTTFWGSIQKANGKSTMAKLKKASQTASSLNPEMLMLLVAVAVINYKLDKIIKISEEILSFLQREKESEIEADVKMLTSIISKYSSNYDNEHYLASNYKLVLDIQRTARKNMIFYEKKIEKLANAKKFALSQMGVDERYKKYEKDFKYYRLTIHTFSLASFLEVLLSGNYSENNILTVKNEILEITNNYSKYHSLCSDNLKQLSHTTVETNTYKGAGKVTNVFSKLFKKVQTKEKIQTKGQRLIEKGNVLEDKYVVGFENVKNPETKLFTDKMESLIFVYNKTQQICCDGENLLLVSNE